MKEENKKIVGTIVAVLCVILLIILAIWFFFRTPVYTVEFSNASGYDSVDVKKNDTVPQPEDPSREGYTFVGWYLNDELYDFSSPVTSDLVLEARFAAVDNSDTFVVKFDSNGGTSVSSQSVTKDNLVSKPSNPVREGFTFVEWTLDGKKFDFNTPITKSITLKASWSKDDDSSKSDANSQSFTVKFDSNGGSAVKSQSVLSGNLVSRPANPTRAGFTFVEWTLNGKSYNFNSKVSKNITLKASWKANSSSANSGNSGNSGNQNQNNPGSDEENQKPVDQNVPVASVKINDGNITLNAGDSHKFTVTIEPGNASNKSVSWSVSGDGASIDSNGNLHVSKGGTFTVTASVDGKSDSVSVSVNSAYVVYLSPIVQEGTGYVMEYRIVRVTKDGGNYEDYQKIYFNGQRITKGNNVDKSFVGSTASIDGNITATIVIVQN